MKLIRTFLCWLQGHPTKVLAAGTILKKERCRRCGRVFVSHIEHPGQLLEWDDHFEYIMRDHQWRIYER